MNQNPILKNKTIKKIFVAQRASLGDTLLSTPTLRAIKETYPDSKTIFLASPAAKDLLDGHPLVDELLVYEKGDSVFPIIKKIWRSDFALILDVSYRSSLFAWLAGIPIRVGRGSKKSFFLTRQLNFPLNIDERYEAENTLDVARFLGINTANFELTISPVQDEEKSNVRKLLSTAGIDLKNDKIVVIAPYSLDDLKDWPPENYQKIIVFLNQHGYKTIIVSGKENRNKAECFLGAYNFAGDTTIRETVYLIQLAKLVICGCTSVLHFAATTNTPTLAIYGPSTPVRWAPRARCAAISKFLKCSPCHNTGRVCPDYKNCIRLITPLEVINETAKILNIPQELCKLNERN